MDKQMQYLIDHTIDKILDDDMEARKQADNIPQYVLDKADKDIDAFIKHIRNFKGG